jgi:uncharacterized protein YggL (DUF469 family)
LNVIFILNLTMISSSSSNAHPSRTYLTSVFSRERNRMHARKTRQRKKEHMQKLQNRADELKLVQIRLKQAISDKNTANILVGLFQNGEDGTEGNGSLAIDPKVEMLMKRSTEDIPDASKIPELPALILLGQNNGKRKATDSEVDDDRGAMLSMADEEDGIDYALLGKDRSVCSPAELDKIRRERNRMHAKRTRDRKRIFMEEMEVLINQLQEENSLLHAHATKLNIQLPPLDDTQCSLAITPELATTLSSAAPTSSATANTYKSCEGGEEDSPQRKGDFFNQIESLIAAAGTFQKRSAECEITAISCAESDVTASTTNHSDHNSFGEEEEEEEDPCHHQLLGSRPSKRQHRALDVPTSVPKSITTTNYSV